MCDEEISQGRPFWIEGGIMKAKFEMSLWQRIKAASIIWWAIVVTGELEVEE